VHQVGDQTKVVFTVSASTHPRHQPAATWVNTTRYCKYNQMLLMVGENIAAGWCLGWVSTYPIHQSAATWV